MTGKRPTGLFITGTNTGVGKTFVATALARTLVREGFRVGVYKPVVSGCRSERPSPSDEFPPTFSQDRGVADDDLELWLAAGRPGQLSQVSPQRFRAALAPPRAAREAGREVDRSLLRKGIKPWLEFGDCVLVEGAGGLFSPIAEGELNADLAHDLGFPLVLVAANALGVIHATLSSLFAARTFRGGLPIAAVVLNDVPQNSPDASLASNFEELVRWCAPCPVWRHAAHGVETPQLATWLNWQPG